VYNLLLISCSLVNLQTLRKNVLLANRILLVALPSRLTLRSVPLLLPDYTASLSIFEGRVLVLSELLPPRVNCSHGTVTSAQFRSAAARSNASEVYGTIYEPRHDTLTYCPQNTSHICSQLWGGLNIECHVLRMSLWVESYFFLIHIDFKRCLVSPKISNILYCWFSIMSRTWSLLTTLHSWIYVRTE
jgi:hypothetical protein